MYSYNTHTRTHFLPQWLFCLIHGELVLPDIHYNKYKNKDEHSDSRWWDSVGQSPLIRRLRAYVGCHVFDSGITQVQPKWNLLQDGIQTCHRYQHNLHVTTLVLESLGSCRARCCHIRLCNRGHLRHPNCPETSVGSLVQPWKREQIVSLKHFLPPEQRHNISPVPALPISPGPIEHQSGIGWFVDTELNR